MKEKLKNIEFLRFLLAEILVLFHLKDFLFRPFNYIPEYKYIDAALKNGEQVVDFFFIISGFFLVYTLKNITTLDFIKKKIIRLLPCMIVVASLYWVESLFGITQFNFLNTFLSDIFMFNSTGLVTTKGSMSSVWFIAILFWVSIFYFYLLRYFNPKNINLTICLIVWLSYTLLIQARHGSLNGNSITIVYSFLSLGLIRGLAGIGIGCFIGLLYLAHPIQNNREKNNYIYTVCEVFLFFGIFSHMSFYSNPINDDLIYLIAFIVLFMSFLYNNGYLSKFLNSNISVILGKYSFCLFISHGLFLKLVKQIFSTNFIQHHIYATPFIFLIICSIFAAILHHFIEVPGAKLMKKWLFTEGEKSSQTAEIRARERESSCRAE